MRHAKRTDANHAEIRDAFRAAGWGVKDTSGIGHGVPDLMVVSPNGIGWMVEVKDGRKAPSARALTTEELAMRAWLERCGARATVVESVADVEAMTTGKRKE